MNELKNELDQAFRLLSAVSVSGDGVELMAAAKEHLRTAYKLAENQEAEEPKETEETEDSADG